MANLYQGVAFSPQTTLSENIGAADTIIKVSDSSVFPDPPNYATIGTDELGETIEYAAKAEGLLSGCTRGVEGTAKSWQKGDVIARNFTAKDHNDMISAVTTAQQTANTATEAAEAAQNSADNAQSTANTAKATAEAALPLSGGTLTGMLSGGLTNEGTEYFYRTTNNTKFVISKSTASTEGVDLRFAPSSAAPQTASRTVTFDGIKTPVNNFEAANKLYVDSSIVRQNFLDNSYFGGLVNQRGQTNYSGTISDTYMFDRWLIYGVGDVTINDDSISVVATSSIMNLHQKIDNPARFSGRTVTFSALLEGTCTIILKVNGEYPISAESTTTEKRIVNLTYTLPTNLTELSTYFQTKQNTNNVKIYAAKLELGSTQTLAHKEGDTWVLNEIPDYATELIKCQRYLLGEGTWGIRTIATLAKDIYGYRFFTPVTMRTIPTISKMIVSNNIGTGEPISINPVNVTISTNSIYCNVNLSFLTDEKKEIYTQARIDTGGYISAEL